jgi:feruloyl esterase
MHGNGGYAGLSPEHPARSAYRDVALSQGFATAYTNTGHDADAQPLGSFAHNNQAREIDFAFRAVHLTAQTARQMVSDYYGEPSAYSYWDGCSTGGRQGLMSAQRFPEDFDGIVVGAPVLDFTGTQLWGVWNARALHDAPISQQQIAAVGEAIYARCDAIDGLEDGLIDDPRNCDFEPASDLPRCDAFDSEAVCFSDEQVDALTKIYRGVESKGEIIFPGQPMGAEKGGGWDEWLIASKGPSRQLLYGQEFLKYLAFPADDPDYDWLQFDFDEGPSKIVEIRKFLDATDPDLSVFRDRGGKIISYFGWADTALSAQMGIDYYEAVMNEMGDEAAKDFYRFFLVPGMFHCRGGIGVDRIDIMTPLINWVEQGVAPDVIVGGREEGGEIVRTRPLCSYPEVARHDGSGSIDVASSFSCSAP